MPSQVYLFIQSESLPHAMMPTHLREVPPPAQLNLSKDHPHRNKLSFISKEF